MKNEINKISFYEDSKHNFILEVNIDPQEDTVWLTQNQMAELFDKDINTISEHINNIYLEEEALKEQTIIKIEGVQKEGKRLVKRNRQYYNLDIIISVGYRVKSKKGIEFRKWATKTLKNHLIQGYTINEKKLTEKLDKFKILQNTIKILERTVSSQRLAINDIKGLFSVVSEYSYALEILDSYDHQNIEIKNSTKRESYKLTYEESIEIINKMKGEFSTGLFGREKDESFKGSLGAIYQSAFGEDVYPSIEEKGANLLYLIVKNHSFVDGNKRIAAAIFLYFMNANSLLYKEDGNKRIADNTLVAITLMIAESNPNEKELIVKVLVNLINSNN